MFFEDNTNNIDSLYAEALILYHSGDLTAAAQYYEEILRLDCLRVKVWQDLAMVYYSLGEYETALDRLYQCLEFDSESAISYYNLGLILSKIGDFNQAISSYQQAIIISPNWVEVYNSYGKTLVETGNLLAAESVYQQAISIQPNFSSYLCLGNIFLARQQVEEAIDAYEIALQLQPRHPDILQNLGLAFRAKNQPIIACLYLGFAAYRQQNYSRALAYYQEFQLHETPDVDFYFALADCYQKLNQPLAAIAVYRQAINQSPHLPELYLALMLALQNIGEVEEAVRVADQGLLSLPNNLSLQLEKKRIFPIVAETNEQIYFYRNQWELGLESLQEISLNTSETKQEAFQAIAANTNFFLQYHGKNDLDLQRKYGQFVCQVMAANYPLWRQPRVMPAVSKTGKIKIGYISACLQWHTVGIVFLGWLRNANREQFELHCYYISEEEDSLTELYRLSCDYFYHIPNNIEKVAQQVIANNLHILVFLDIGMYPPMTQLAGLQLAPVQCAAWGHPVTTGLPTIDYFISADLMEPASADNHYSEKLIRLPNLGICYVKPVIPPLSKNRLEFGLKDDCVVYLSCQSLFKYLPKYDFVFAEIAQQVPRAQFVFVSHTSDKITDKFRQRLRRAFAHIGLDSESYCVFLPRLSKADYWNLLLLADIFLDSFDFTGFLTTLEAVSCDLPVVTCRGEFMRGCQSAGVLQRIGVRETLANHPTEYIKIAVTLGLKQQDREKIIKKIHQHKILLYNDKKSVEALEALFKNLVFTRA